MWRQARRYMGRMLHTIVMYSTRDMCYINQSQNQATPMTTPNPRHLANTAQKMARMAPKDDAVVFNKVAMVCMGVMAAA